MVKYMQKDSVVISAAASILCDARDHIARYESRADDKGTDSRTAKHFLARVLNSATAELALSQAVSVLLRSPSADSSEPMEYHYAWDFAKLASIQEGGGTGLEDGDEDDDEDENGLHVDGEPCAAGDSGDGGDRGLDGDEALDAADPDAEHSFGGVQGHDDVVLVGELVETGAEDALEEEAMEMEDDDGEAHDGERSEACDANAAHDGEADDDAQFFMGEADVKQYLSEADQVNGRRRGQAGVYTNAQGDR